MKFLKYRTIENHYNKKATGKIKFTPFYNQTWLCFEKLHGCNFSVYINKNEVKYAKRNGFIQDFDDFHNYKEAVKNINIDLIREKELINGVEEFILFGELVGGNTQKGVNYSDEVDFICFNTVSKIKDNYYVSNLYHSNPYNLKRPTLLFEGYFEECLKFNNDFTSTYGDFKAEGFVMTPKVQLVRNDTLYYDLIMFKSKNSKYSERGGKKIVIEELKEEHKEIIEKCSPYLNKNRLNNLYSKIGNKERIEKVSGMLIKDALIDLEKDSVFNYNDLEKKDKKVINKELTIIAVNLIRNNNE